MNKITLLAASCLACSVSTASIIEDAPTTPVTYNNVFISYFSTADVTGMMNYINSHKDAQGNAAPLKGFIMWEFRGDMPYDSPLSLLATANAAIDPKNPPMLMGYWTDWTVYSPGRMFNEPAYGVPGSLDSVTGQAVANPDFTGKLEGLNTITYGFLEAQPINNPLTGKPNAAPGALYFNDPWSDLQSSDYKFCSSNPAICYTSYLQTKPSFTTPTDQASFNQVVKMGNFPAFANLTHSSAATTKLGSLKKIFSVGGYGHDISFEDTITSTAYIDNFVNSAVAILDQYHFDGIDLDYEDPSMTLAQSKQFATLVDALSAKLTPQGKQIFVTILSNPAYILGVDAKNNNTFGFSPGVLAHIAQQVTGINLMTYDFHGAFDYNTNSSGKTGFLSNINQYGTDPFNVINAVNSTTSLGVPPNKISVGIPAYGRALQGISKGQDGTGLNEAISDTAIPKGDLDSPNCSTDITNIGPNSCSGSFEYQFIQRNLLGKGFIETSWPSQVATTAYADTWTYSPAVSSYNLTISNTSALGIEVNVNGSAFGSGYIGPNLSPVFSTTSNPNTKAINGDSNLAVAWATYTGGPTGNCSAPLNLTNNMTIKINVPSQAGSPATCDIATTPASSK